MTTATITAPTTTTDRRSAGQPRSGQRAASRARAGGLLAAAFLAAGGLSSCGNAADKVELTSGITLRGTVISQDDKSVTIRTRSGVTLTLWLENVKSVTTAAGTRTSRRRVADHAVPRRGLTSTANTSVRRPLHAFHETHRPLRSV